MRKRGDYTYKQSDFIALVSKEPKSTQDLMKLHNKTNHNLSWNTLQAVLTRLKNEGKIKGKRIGRTNIWWK